MFRNPLLTLTPALCALFLAGVSLQGCSGGVYTRQYSEEPPGLYTTETVEVAESKDIHQWSISRGEDVEILSKRFSKGESSKTVYTVGLESCGAPSGENRRLALIRQLFIGFDDVQVKSVQSPSWTKPGFFLARVSAAIDDNDFSVIVFSQVKNECLVEQAFWSNADGTWLHDQEMEKILFGELLTLPPWSNGAPHVSEQEDLSTGTGG